MNKLIGLLVFCAIALGSLTIVSCGDDDGGEQLLHYDGDNVSGPLFNEGAYVAAVRFPSSVMAAYEGQQINSVDLYFLERPTSARLVLLSGNPNSTVPTGEITGQSLGSITQDNWNRISLNTPYVIDGSEIWIGIDFGLDSPAQVIGCDAGPANRNGDFIYQEAENIWTTYRDLSTTESINWNIRAVLTE